MSDRPTAVDNLRTAQVRLFAATGTHAVSRMLRLPDTWAHVIEAGSGRPVVLVHDSAGSAAAWVPLMSWLQDQVHVFAPDWPGSGLTDRVSFRGVEFRDHVVSFLDKLLDELGLSTVSLVGCGLGGYSVLAYALARQYRVQRLALLGAPAGARAMPTPRERMAGTPGLRRLVSAGPPGSPRTRLRAWMGRALVAHPERLPEPLLDAVHASSVLPGVNRSWKTLTRTVAPPWARSRLTYALGDELRRIRMPVLLVWGDRDPCPPSLAGRICGLLPEARLEVLPGAGHLVWLDEPDRTAALLLEFLAPGGRRSRVRSSSGD